MFPPVRRVARRAVRPDYREMTTTERPPDLPTAPVGDPIAHLQLELDWRWRRPTPRPRLPKGEPREEARPVRCVASDGDSLSAPADALPYADGSVAAVDAGTIFAYVRNDDGLAGELWRLLRPGGTVTLRVPATGPLAGLDAYNVFRYVVDVSGRGPRVFEVGDLGWRRHYAEAEVIAMFGPERFTVRSRRRSGLALGELVRLAAQLAFRWLRPSADRYRRMAGVADKIERWERGITFRHGFWLTITLEKTATAAP